MTRLVPRTLARYVAGTLLREHPTVMIVGARAVGKTTALRGLAATVLDLSVPDTRGAVRADPDAALMGLPEPLFIDEWQEVPEVLGALKRATDSDPRPGRFLITGSVRASLVAEARAATGRRIRRTMYGLSQGELEGGPDRFAEIVWADPESLARSRSLDLNRTSYLEMACRGGFPQAALASPAARTRWLASYIEDLVERDAVAVGGVREPRKLRSVLRLAAARTGQLLKKDGMARDAGVNVRTLAAHLDLLASMFLVREIPPWSSNLSARVAKSPKLHLTDSGLAAHLMGKAPEALRLDGPASGAVLETFAVTEILRQIEWCGEVQEPFFFRDHAGREVDLVLERRDGSVVGLEVKAGTSVDTSDLAGLRYLRDRLGSRFHAGIVLFTGGFGRTIEDRILSVPMSALWRAGR